VDADHDVAHARTKCLGGDAGNFDRRRGRKNAGKKRVQRTAIIGVIAAGAVVDVRASIVPLSTGVMVSGMLTRGSGNSMRLRQWRRDDTSELGDEE
jgi:hypothetical protein